jgi:hypothetical protein
VPLLSHVPALDGFRACAVLAVMLYLAGVSWMPGGSFGVDAFFVLSGLLITSLLLAERVTARGAATCAGSGPAGPGDCCRRCCSCCWASPSTPQR